MRRHLPRCLAYGQLPGGLAQGLPDAMPAMVMELCESYTTRNLIVRCMSEGPRVYTNAQALDWLMHVRAAPR